MIKVAVCGALGKMGREVVDAVNNAQDMELSAKIDIIGEGVYKNIEEAYNILQQTTVLPAVCGRICPHYRQCMGSCVRGIKGEAVNIGELEAFVGDTAISNDWRTIT